MLALAQLGVTDVTVYARDWSKASRLVEWALELGVGLVRGAPHAKAADALANFLADREQVARLVAAGALEATEWPPVGAAGFRPDWGTVLADLEAATEQLRRVFLR